MVKKSWDLHEGRHAYKNKKNIFIDPEIKELEQYWKKKNKNSI